MLSGLSRELLVVATCVWCSVKLLPTIEQAQSLRATLDQANAARSWIAERGHAKRCFGRTALHRLSYRESRERFGLSAQMAVRAIGSVVECFNRDRRTLPVFRAHAAFPYDSRILRIDRERGEISIWTLVGRQAIPFVCGERQRELLQRAETLGECDLRPLADGRWMLDITVEVQAPEPFEPTEWLGWISAW